MQAAAKLLSSEERKSIAIEVLGSNKPVSQISRSLQVSRKFIYSQKTIAIEAINEVFGPEEKDESSGLFSVKVTKNWLEGLVLALALHGRSSFRGIIKILEDMFGYQISVGTIHNILNSAVEKAQSVNSAQRLENIHTGAQDELFHHGKPVLAGIDTKNLYCYLLSQEESRDTDTWAIHFLDLVKQGFNPEQTIADNGNGLRAGQRIACEHIPCHGDIFHMIKELMELRRFFRNRLKTAASYLEKLNHKIEKQKNQIKKRNLLNLLLTAQQNEKTACSVSGNIDILVNWLEHDIFEKAGYPLQERKELYDFIVVEFKKLEVIHSHRIKGTRTALENQRDNLLSFVAKMEQEFLSVASAYYCDIADVWKICQLQRYSKDNAGYYTRAEPIRKKLRHLFYPVEQAVIKVMQITERTSSAVENFNSRIRPYFSLRGEIGHGYLSLLRFYLNHTPFLRSSSSERAGKSPAELLFQKKHPHWLEMLGVEPFRRAA